MSLISLSNVTLEYELFFDRTQTLKEYIVNLIHRRKYTETRCKKLLALDGINLTIKNGERLGIIGHNGAGKSTLLKVIAGILKPQKGYIHVDGFIQPLIEVGAGFNPELTGRDNIFLNSYMLGFTNTQVKSKINEIIQFSELEKFIDIPVKYYSSGMAVRLAFTIATLIEPEILLFDEMLSAGDASFIEKAKMRIENLIQKANIMVLVSHDLQLIETVCNRAILLESGKILFDGSPKECIATYLDISRLKKN